MEAQEFSTGEVSRLVGVSVQTLYRWLRQGRLPDPPRVQFGSVAVRVWTARDVERAQVLRIHNRRHGRIKSH
jgi:DNA-binding transcriptional MerR regulator